MNFSKSSTHRIEEITGIDLDDPDTLLYLLLSYKLMESAKYFNTFPDERFY